MLIGKKPAARMGDMAVCVGPPSSVIMGCPTVMIGEAGSGSQAGSAGAAAAAAAAAIKGVKAVNPIQPPKHEPTPAEETSVLQVVVKDSAGKPLSGASFLLEDPDGVKHLVATGTDGSFSRSGGWKSGKSFKATFRALSATKIDKSELKDGDQATLTAKVEGYPAGASGLFRLTVDTIEGESDLAMIPAVVKGDKIETQWTYRAAQVVEILGAQNVEKEMDLAMSLMAVCGFDSCVAQSVTKLKVEPAKPVTVKSLRSA